MIIRKFSSGRSDYSELGNVVKKTSFLSAIQGPESVDIPSIGELEDGEYQLKRYGYIAETEDGRRFRTKTGVRNQKTFSRFKTYVLRGDNLREKQLGYSGYAQIAPIADARTYGPKWSGATTRVTLDHKGFKIPDNIIKKFDLK